MSDWLLKDKALIYGENMWLTETWDFVIVSWYEGILQAAQNRVLSYIETWKFDDSYGSDIQKIMHDMPAAKVTDSIMNTYVSFALQSMILDGRVKSVDSVKIISRSNDSILIEIILTMGTYRWSIVIDIPNFIS